MFSYPILSSVLRQAVTIPAKAAIAVVIFQNHWLEGALAS